MTEQAWWVIALVAVVITGVIAFFIGRQTASSRERERVDELEEALSREKAALADYRDQVDAHFDKSAGLFVAMAGSYKDLFDHLSSGYENLSPGASRELFKDRVSALLLESRPAEAAPDEVPGARAEDAPVFAQTVAADSPASAQAASAPDQGLTPEPHPEPHSAQASEAVPSADATVDRVDEAGKAPLDAQAASIGEPALTLEKSSADDVAPTLAAGSSDTPGAEAAGSASPQRAGAEAAPTSIPAESVPGDDKKPLA